MTDAQIEVAARHFCRALGLDPDQRVQGPDERYPTLSVERPAWQVHASTVRQALAMLEALTAAESTA